MVAFFFVALASSPVLLFEFDEALWGGDGLVDIDRVRPGGSSTKEVKFDSVKSKTNNNKKLTPVN